MLWPGGHYTSPREQGHARRSQLPVSSLYISTPRCTRVRRPSLSTSLLEVGGQPLESLVETVSAGRTRRLDEPLSLSEGVESELVGDLGRVHGVWQILLVGKDEEEGVSQLVLVQHPLQLLSCLADSLSVVRVDDKDDALRVLEIWHGSVARSRDTREAPRRGQVGWVTYNDATVA